MRLTPSSYKWKLIGDHCRQVYHYNYKFVLKKEKSKPYYQNKQEINLLSNKDKLIKKIKIGKYNYKFVYPEVVSHSKDYSWAIFTYIGNPEYHDRDHTWDDEVLNNMLDTITYIRLNKIIFDLHEYNLFVDHEKRLIYIWDLGLEYWLERK